MRKRKRKRWIKTIPRQQKTKITSVTTVITSVTTKSKCQISPTSSQIDQRYWNFIFHFEISFLHQFPVQMVPSGSKTLESNLVSDAVFRTNSISPFQTNLTLIRVFVVTIRSLKHNEHILTYGGSIIALTYMHRTSQQLHFSQYIHF